MRSGYASDYISRLAREGKIAGERIGRAWFVEPGAVEAFVEAQLDRKLALSEELARARAAEYQQHAAIRSGNGAQGDSVDETAPVAGTQTVSDEPPLEGATLSPYQRERTEHAAQGMLRALARAPGMLPQPSRAQYATALTALVIAGSAATAGSGIVDDAARITTSFAFESRASVIASAGRMIAHADERRALLAREAQEGSVELRDRALSEASLAYDPFVAAETLMVGMSDVPSVTALLVAPAYEDAERFAVTMPSSRVSADFSLDLLRAVAHPEETLGRMGTAALLAYRASGERILDAGAFAASQYMDVLASAGEEALGASVGARDASREALIAYRDAGYLLARLPDVTASEFERGAHAFAALSHRVPEHIVGTLYRIGDATGSALATGIVRGPAAYETAVARYASAAASAGEGIAERGAAFGRASRATALALLSEQDRVIRTAVRSAESMFGNAVAVQRSALTASVTSAERTLLAASPMPALEAAFMAFGGYVRTAFVLLDETLSVAYERALHGVSGPFATLFSLGRNVELVMVPTVPPAERMAPATSDAPRVVSYAGPVTQVYNSYPTLYLTGVTEAAVDQKVERLRYQLVRSIENSRDRDSGSSSINGLSGEGLTLIDSVWQGGTIEALSVEAADFIAGPYVLATSTTATSAFSGNIAVGRDTTLGTAATDLLTVNARVASSLIPLTNDTYDLGAPGAAWRAGYFDEIIVNNFSVASTSIAGTASDTFEINADNASSDAEDMALSFNRGSESDALLSWNSALDRFEFNMPVWSVDALFERATSTDLAVVDRLTVAGNIGIGTTSSTASLSVAGGQTVLDRNASIASADLANATLLLTNPSASTALGLDTNEIFSSGMLTIGTLGGNRAVVFSPNGTERMRVQDGGNVGIGTSSPSTKLHIESTGSDSDFLTLFGNRNTSNSEVGIAFRDRDVFGAGGQLFGRIYTQRAVNNGWADLVFATAPNSSSNATEKLRITASGNVGVGTSSPSSQLHIFSNAGATPATLTIENANTSGATHSIIEQKAATGKDSQFRFTEGSTTHWTFGRNGSASNALYWTNNAGFGAGSTRMVLTPAGNLGVGTTSPAARLDIYDSASNPSMLQISRSNLNAFRISNGSGAPSTIKFQVSSDFSTFSDALSIVAVSSGGYTQGHVGVNNLMPRRRIDILDASSPQLRLTYADNTQYTDFQTTSSGNLYINPSGGNVGIGTTSPTNTLGVAGSAYITAGVGIGAQPLNASQPGLYVERLSDGGTVSPVSIANPGTAVNTEAGYDFRLSGTASGRISNIRRGSTDRGLAFYTYDSSLTERMYISGSGNVGINTTTPDARLFVRGGGAGTGRALVVSDSSNADRFRVLDNGAISVSRDVDSTSDALSVANINGGTSAISRLAMSNGTSNGDLQFSLYGTGYTLTMPYGLNVANWGELSTLGSANGLVIGTRGSGDPLVFGTNNTERMRVDGTTGNVGIGDISPSAKLQVNSTSAGAVSNALYLSNSSGTGGTGVRLGFNPSATNNSVLAAIDGIRSNTGGSGATYLALSTHNGTSLAEKVRISESGSVGIGIAATEGKLHVFNGNSGAQVPNGAADELVIENVSATGMTIKSGNTNTGNIWFADSGASGAGRIVYDHSADSMAFYTSTSQQLTIASSGSVGIGSATPGTKLHVNLGGTALPTFNAATGFALSQTSSSGNNANLAIIAGNMGASQLYFGDTDSENAGRLRYDHTNNELEFYVSGSERMVVNSSGNIGIGTTSPNQPLHVSGGSRFQGTLRAQSGFGAGAIVLGANVNSYDVTTATRKVGRIVSPAYNTSEDSILVFGVDNTATDNEVFYGGDPGSGTVTAATALRFVTASAVGTAGGAERMRITGSGNIGIGTSTPTDVLTTQGSSLAAGMDNVGVGMHYQGASGRRYDILSCFNCGTAGLGGLEVYDATAAAGRAYISAGVNGWQTPSDARLKSNIRTISVLDRIDGVRGTTYTLNDSGIPQIGVIAQEIQAAFPEAVSGSTEAGRYLGVSYDAIASIALQGVKELNTRTLTLGTTTSALAARISGIETAASAGLQDITANEVVAARLAVTGTASAGRFLADASSVQFAFGSSTHAAVLPSEVREGGRADLYRMSSYAVAGMQESLRRTDLLFERLDTIEERIAQLEADAAAKVPGIALEPGMLEKLADLLERISIRDAMLAAVGLVTDRLTVGSAEKPIGITLYDEVTGEPYCFAIRNGAQVVRAGECEVTDRMQPAPPSVPEEPVAPAPEPEVPEPVVEPALQEPEAAEPPPENQEAEMPQAEEPVPSEPAPAEPVAPEPEAPAPEPAPQPEPASEVAVAS